MGSVDTTPPSDETIRPYARQLPRQDEVKKLIHWLVKIYLEIDDAEYVSIVQEELQYSGYSKELVDIGTEALFHYGNKYKRYKNFNR